MEKEIWIAIIGAIASISIAAGTFYYNRKVERDTSWKKEKYEKYKKLLTAISDSAIQDNDKEKAAKKFSEESNTICLVASQEVITSLMNFHNEAKKPRKKAGVTEDESNISNQNEFENKNFDINEHDRLLKKLMLEIRKDIGLTDNEDNEKTFEFHLIG